MLRTGPRVIGAPSASCPLLLASSEAGLESRWAWGSLFRLMRMLMVGDSTGEVVNVYVPMGVRLSSRHLSLFCLFLLSLCCPLIVYAFHAQFVSGGCRSISSRSLIADVCVIVILAFVLKAVLVPLLPYGSVGILAHSVSERGRSLFTCASLSLPMEARSSS